MYDILTAETRRRGKSFYSLLLCASAVNPKIMIQLLKMAFRNLMRNKRRSFFSALALGMGLGLLMLIAGVVNGEYRSALDSAIRLQSGHVQVRAKTFDESKSSLAWEDLVENPPTWLRKLARSRR